MTATPQAPYWWLEIRRRVRILVTLKAIGTPLGIAVFFVGYFWTLRHPLFAVTVMPLVAADHWIAFVPELLPLYASLWLYVSLLPALLGSGRELVRFGLGTLALSLIGLGIFLLWPTAVPVFEIDWARHPGFEWLKQIDVAGNACPSLHAAFAVFIACWFQRVLAEIGTPPALRVLNWLWCAGIVYSTVAVRQHVALDAVAGCLLGGAIGVLNLRVPRGLHPPGLSRRGMRVLRR